MRQLGSVKSAIAQIISLTSSTALLSVFGASAFGAETRAPATTVHRLSMTLSASAENAQPAFHLAPVFLIEPEDTDRIEPATSARARPHRAAVRPEFSQLSTRRLTPAIMEQMLRTGTAPEASLARGTGADPFTTASTVTVYTPAQIRAAYSLPSLPSTSASVSSAQAAQLGAGQTIYVVDADNDPNVAAELASFNSKFGLPACTVTQIAVTATLPLAPAPSTGCVFSVVYSTAAGVRTGTAPPYSSSWQPEIALDVQWAHATAPYARIILIEAPDATTVSLAAAVGLANAMGPGVVSQSFGATEGGFTSYYDPIFSVANMTYVAATGDSGEAVNWPSVSTHVLAVGGTSLSYSGGARGETVWSGTGGGISAYTATPSYQTLAVPGITRSAFRGVADVTFNADPNTGQYLALMLQGATTVSWYSVGGTSLATPQWAGIIAIANAERAQAATSPIGASQPTLYGLATQASTYASNFLDVKSGSDGTCTTCYAGAGYDLPSGLGSPNVASLLTALVGQPPASAPVVTAASVSGKVGTALSFSLTATDTYALTYSLTGAPSGMTVNTTTGAVSWPAPVAGSYKFSAIALDATTGLSGQATISVSIVAPQPPTLSGGSISGVAQTALTFTAQATDVNVVTYSLSGAPSGMTVSTAGVVSWASPLPGIYAVTVIAKDATTSLSGEALYTVSIVAPSAPVVTASAISGTVGKALSFTVNAKDANPLTYSLTGAPSGMTIASTGLVSWSNPTSGSFSVTVTAKDAKTGLSGSGIYAVTISPTGPVVQAVTLTGVAGKTLTGSIGITDTTANALSITISGVPAGMSATASAGVLTLTWSLPVTGNYSLRVVVVDNKNLTGSATIPVTITAH
jgi:subtilase family serine protease